MDWEGDIFALFRAPQPRVHLWVRAKVDWCIPQNRKLFATMCSGKAAGSIGVPIARLSRREKSDRLKHKGRTGRIARMEARYHRITPRPIDAQTADHGYRPYIFGGLRRRKGEDAV